MDILRNLRRLESRLTRTVDDAAQKITRTGAREPLEILHAIVDAAERRMEPAGRGTYVFPFDRINICIAADSSEARARFQAVLGSEPLLHDRIVQRLRAAGCQLADLTVNTTYVDSAESDWTTSQFNVAFERFEQPNVISQSLKLTVVHGETEKPTYVFTTSRINLGRCPEVRDHRNRLIRTNHVAFVENAGEPNLSVSRQHAHVVFIGVPGEYRLCDDRSAHGTNVLRDGKTIPVPPGPRGVRLQSGDQIILGEARVQVEIEPQNLPMDDMR